MTQHGINLPKAYIRLMDLNTNRNFINVQFAVYANKTAFEESKAFVEVINKQISIEDEEFRTYFDLAILDGKTNPIKQAYIYLLSLEEFSSGKEI